MKTKHFYCTALLFLSSSINCCEESKKAEIIEYIDYHYSLVTDYNNTSDNVVKNCTDNFSKLFDAIKEATTTLSKKNLETFYEYLCNKAQEEDAFKKRCAKAAQSLFASEKPISPKQIQEQFSFLTKDLKKELDQPDEFSEKLILLLKQQDASTELIESLKQKSTSSLKHVKNHLDRFTEFMLETMSHQVYQAFAATDQSHQGLEYDNDAISCY